MVAEAGAAGGAGCGGAPGGPGVREALGFHCGAGSKGCVCPPQLTELDTDEGKFSWMQDMPRLFLKSSLRSQW